MWRAVPPLIAGLLLSVPGVASAAPLKPFDHSCTPKNGVRFCETKNDGQRVPSFDGVPLDVDVTLPATGEGPFPTIIMLHGFPGSKTSFEATMPEGSPDPAGSSANVLYHWNNNFFAKQGYVVVNYSARGFGRSCGDADSRTSPECDKGWFHLADQRYEIRDAQELLSTLVDQGIADPERIGSTGVSYGGGSTLQLAFLGNRIRKLDGTFKPWTSPGGKQLSLAAAYPRWGWSDLAYSLAPNGRFLDSRVPSQPESRRPVGIVKDSVVDTLRQGGSLAGFLAPKGADPTADLITWRNLFFAGVPYGTNVQGIVDQFVTYKGVSLLAADAPPLLIMDGWTDPAFNAVEALRAYNRLRAVDPNAAVSLQLGDLGHFRSGNGLKMYKDFNDEGAAFFAQHLKGVPGGPKPGAVKAYGQGCPKGKVGPGPVAVSSWQKLARGNVAERRRDGVVKGADNGTGKFFDPVTNGDPCSRTKVKRPKGSMVLTRTSRGFTLAGLTTITARITKSSNSFGQLDARLFDISKGKARLVDWGTYRLKPKQTGRIKFQTAGNLYRFVPGHVVRLELVARNAPWLLGDAKRKVELLFAKMDIPTREKPNPALGITAP